MRPIRTAFAATLRRWPASSPLVAYKSHSLIETLCFRLASWLREMLVAKDDRRCHGVLALQSREASVGSIELMNAY